MLLSNFTRIRNKDRCIVQQDSLARQSFVSDMVDVSHETDLGGFRCGKGGCRIAKNFHFAVRAGGRTAASLLYRDMEAMSNLVKLLAGLTLSFNFSTVLQKEKDFEGSIC
jgi:hypothetical protein